MARKGLIALFSGLGIVGILLLLLVIGSIIGVIVWYYKKKEGLEFGPGKIDYQYAGSMVCRNKYKNNLKACIDCTKTTGVDSHTANYWCGGKDPSCSGPDCVHL